MATKLLRPRQQKFSGCRKKSGHGAEDGAEEIHTNRDGYGSIHQGCFSSFLKSNLKAFCGRMHHNKSSSLCRYFHVNAALDPHPSSRALQKPKSKSRGKSKGKHSDVLADPISPQQRISLTNAPLHSYSSPPAFQKQESKSKQAQPMEHSDIGTEHEEIKGIVHLDHKGSTFTSTDGIKSTALDSCLYEETKNAVCHQHPHNPSSIDTLEKSPSLIEGFEQVRQDNVSAKQAGLKRQTTVLSGIHELMLEVAQFSLGLEGNPLTSLDDEKHSSSRSLQFEIPKPNLRSANLLNVQGLHDSLNRRSISRSTPDSNRRHRPKPHSVDDILSSLAALVFSLRDQMMRGGYEGSVHTSSQLRHRRANVKNCYGNGNAYDVGKPTAAGLISARRLEDLADLEDFLQCYMRLYSPCFLDMVNHIFCEICDDIFKCEGLDPFVRGA